MPKSKVIYEEMNSVILKLINYFTLELQNGGPLIPLTAIQERVASALDLSISSIARAVQVAKKPAEPKERKKRMCPKTTDCDSVVKNDIMRTIIYDMHQHGSVKWAELKKHGGYEGEIMINIRTTCNWAGTNTRKRSFDEDEMQKNEK